MRNSDWEHALENSALAEREKRQHRVIIRWFSAYCRKQHPPAPPGRELANEFDRNVLRARKREDWQLAQWRAGLRWFLEYLGERPRSLTAPPDREPHGEAAGGKPPQAGAAHAPALETGTAVHRESPGAEPGRSTVLPGRSDPWRLSMIGQLRLKHWKAPNV